MFSPHVAVGRKTGSDSFDLVALNGDVVVIHSNGDIHVIRRVVHILDVLLVKHAHIAGIIDVSVCVSAVRGSQ